METSIKIDDPIKLKIEPSFKLKLGDIVSLNTHPFFENQTSVIITGDHQTTPPLMVVAEILLNTKSQYDEMTAEEIAIKGHAECKCLWFSTKTNQFEEAWVSSKLLKLIKAASPNEDRLEIFPANKLVVFRTSQLELGKQKSSLNIENNAAGDKFSTSTTALLSFVSPVMQVISVKINDEKVPKFDSKTGTQKRFLPTHLVKCKWYNPSNEKMSEKVLPFEVLEVLPFVDQKRIDEFSRAINERQHFHAEIDDALTIFKPTKVTFRSGYYYLSGYDYIFNQSAETRIDIAKLATLSKPFLYDGPKYDDLAAAELGAKAKHEILGILSEPGYEKNYIRIVYKNRNDIVRTRTVANFKIAADDQGEPKFLKGYCFFRQETRTFRLDRIQRLQVLDLQIKK